MKFQILLLTLAATSMPSAAQQLLPREQQRFRTEVQRSVDTYQSTLQWMQDEDNALLFNGLFNDGSARVYNDILGTSTNDSYPATEYSRLMTDYPQAVDIRISNLKLGEIGWDGRHYTMDVTFDKEMVFQDGCDILYNSQDYFGAPYNLTMHFIWDPETRCASITGIDGKVDSARERLSSNYTVLQYNDPKDLRVKVDGKRPEFNRFNQAFIGSYSKLGFSDPDLRVYLTRTDAKCPISTFSYKPKRFAVKPWAGMSAGDIFDVQSTVKNLSVTSKSKEIGLDLGFIMNSSPVKFGIFTGAGMVQTDLTFNLSYYNYDYLSDQDIDGDTYRRVYKNVDAEQSIKVTELVVPLYLDINMPLGSGISFYLDLGGRAYLPMQYKAGDYRATYECYGIYPSYDNLVLDESFGHNGFVRSGVATPDNSEAQTVKFKTSVDAFGQAGFRFKLFSSVLLDLGASYLYNIVPSYDTVSEKLPLIWMMDGKTGHEVVNVSQLSDKISRKGLRLSAGLIFKF